MGAKSKRKRIKPPPPPTTQAVDWLGRETAESKRRHEDYATYMRGWNDALAAAGVT